MIEKWIQKDVMKNLISKKIAKAVSKINIHIRIHIKHNLLPIYSKKKHSKFVYITAFFFLTKVNYF